MVSSLGGLRSVIVPNVGGKLRNGEPTLMMREAV